MGSIDFFPRYRIIASRVLGLLLLALLLFTQRPFSGSETTRQVLYWLGFVLLIACTLGRLWSLQYLEGYKTRRLVDEGPFSVVRNPLYLFSFAGALGFVLVADHLWVALLVLGAFLLYYPFVVLAEERGLREKLGEEYAEYCSRVNRFLPRWRGYREPEEALIRARRFSRNYLEVVWFLLGFMLLSILLGFKRAGFPPDLF